MSISGQLDSVRSERKKADYKLRDSRFANRAAVEHQIRKATAIIADQSAAGAELATFRPVIRTYAKNVLRPGVRGD